MYFRQGPRRAWREHRATLVVSGVAFIVVQTFLVQGFHVSGSCMVPNLVTGERLLGSKLVYRLRRPRRGDIVVFRSPTDPDRIYVKRIVGLPGETLTIRSGTVYLDGLPLREPYVVNTARGDTPPFRVPVGHYFVLGDNRDHSSDSRAWGTVPASCVVGRAWLRYWPPGRVGVLN